MLVLTRSKGKAIAIGPDIVVTVLDTQGTQVKLGIHAPREIAVLREEVFRRADEQERSSAE